MIYPAIVVIAYNRPASLSRLLSSIARADYPKADIELIISIDFYKTDNECYKIADDFEWKQGKKTVLKHKDNLGLRKHVLQCGDLSEKYEAVILLEDDIAVSRAFYRFSVEAVNYYYEHEEVAGIGLFSHRYNGYAQFPFEPYKNGYDTYYEKWVITWGECFCKNQWKAFRRWYSDNSGRLEYKDSIPHQITEWSDSSWSKYLVYYMDENNKYFISPYDSFSTNFSEAGDHVEYQVNTWQNSMQDKLIRELVFADEATSVKYDLFFERMSFQEEAPLMDLYGIRTISKKDKKILSTRRLPYTIEKSFGLKIHPIEQNVVDEIPGNEIFQYSIDQKARQEHMSFSQNYSLYKYFYPMLQYKSTLKYMCLETVNKIKTKLKKGHGHNKK